MTNRESTVAVLSQDLKDRVRNRDGWSQLSACEREEIEITLARIANQVIAQVSSEPCSIDDCTVAEWKAATK